MYPVGSLFSPQMAATNTNRTGSSNKKSQQIRLSANMSYLNDFELQIRQLEQQAKHLKDEQQRDDGTTTLSSNSNSCNDASSSSSTNSNKNNNNNNQNNQMQLHQFDFNADSNHRFHENNFNSNAQNGMLNTTITLPRNGNILTEMNGFHGPDLARVYSANLVDIRSEEHYLKQIK